MLTAIENFHACMIGKISMARFFGLIPFLSNGSISAPTRQHEKSPTLINYQEYSWVYIFWHIRLYILLSQWCVSDSCNVVFIIETASGKVSFSCKEDLFQVAVRRSWQFGGNSLVLRNKIILGARNKIILPIRNNNRVHYECYVCQFIFFKKQIKMLK